MAVLVDEAPIVVMLVPNSLPCGLQLERELVAWWCSCGGECCNLEQQLLLVVVETVPSVAAGTKCLALRARGVGAQYSSI